MRIFTIAGWSNSGKTTLIIKLIKELKKKGLKVMALKNASEKYYLEPEGKDSLNFLQAGADSVFLSSKKELMKMELIADKNRLFEKLEIEFEKYDVILLEGLMKEGSPIIEVFNFENNNKLKVSKKELYAIVSDNYSTKDIQCFKRDEIDKIIKYLLDE